MAPAKLTPKAAEFLRGVHFAKLATVKKDGSPQLTPIWYMLDDGRLIVNTTRDRAKFRNMSRDARVSFLVDNGYQYVVIYGEATEAKDRDPKKDIESLAIRYTGEEAGRKAARERFWKMERVSVEITPSRIIEDLG